MTQQDVELEQIKAKIQEHLITLGTYDRINKQLKLQLYEAGWYDKVLQMALGELQNGANFDDLMGFVKPRAQDLVPETVRENVLQKIKEYLDDIIQ